MENFFCWEPCAAFSMRPAREAGYCVITKAQKVENPNTCQKVGTLLVTRKLSRREASRDQASGRVGFRLAFKKMQCSAARVRAAHFDTRAPARAMPSVKELAARIERSSQQREAAAAASLSPPRRRRSLGSPGRLGSPRTPAEVLAAAAPRSPTAPVSPHRRRLGSAQPAAASPPPRRRGAAPSRSARAASPAPSWARFTSTRVRSRSRRAPPRLLRAASRSRSPARCASAAGRARAPPPPPRRPPPRSHPRTRARRSRSSPTCTGILSVEERLDEPPATPALRRTRIEIEL